MLRFLSVKAAVLENVNYEIDENGKLVNSFVRGRITASTPKRTKSLQLVLSNTYRMTEIQLSSNVVHSTLPLGRSVVVDLSGGENTILEYVAHAEELPLGSTMEACVADNALICDFELDNKLKHRGVMGNNIENIQVCISTLPKIDSKSADLQGDGQAAFSTDDKVVWTIRRIDSGETRKLTLRFSPSQKLKRRIVDGEFDISFKMPSRTASGIFIEKIQTSRRLMGYEVPADFSYETHCEHLRQKYECSIREYTSGGKADLVVEKRANKTTVKRLEDIQIIVSVRNMGANPANKLRISDSIPRGLRLKEGTSSWFGRVGPGETREINYVIVPKISGRFILPSAKATYESLDGTRRASESPTLGILVEP